MAVNISFIMFLYNEKLTAAKLISNISDDIKKRLSSFKKSR